MNWGIIGPAVLMAVTFAAIWVVGIIDRDGLSTVTDRIRSWHWIFQPALIIVALAAILFYLTTLAKWVAEEQKDDAA